MEDFELDIQECIRIMKAFEDGHKIEWRIRSENRDGCWHGTSKPLWDWYRNEYRIADEQEVETPDISDILMKIERLEKRVSDLEKRGETITAPNSPWIPYQPYTPYTPTTDPQPWTITYSKQPK